MSLSTCVVATMQPPRNVLCSACSSIASFEIRSRSLRGRSLLETTTGAVFRSVEPAYWRHTLAGCKVIIHQHLDTTLTLMIAGHRLGHYRAQGKLLTPLSKKQIKAVEKTLRATTWAATG
jgi:hypothetical protein